MRTKRVCARSSPWITSGIKGLMHKWDNLNNLISFNKTSPKKNDKNLTDYELKKEIYM